MGSAPPSDSRIGDFEIVRLLGKGGMGAVFLARDATGREVALKLLSDHALDDAGRERFVREARAAAAVSHKNVTRIHTAGEDRGRVFIVFEWVRGGSLGARLKATGRLPWSEAVAHATGIARGLEAIHRAGFVHRDLKPDNVLLDEEGTPKVSDLGLARALAPDSAQALTKTGEILGTPGFMAPEQIDHARHADVRADIYALGATLHALLAGAPPFDGHGTALLLTVLQTPPPRLRRLVPGVPVALERLVLQCLEKSPDRRPASAREVAGRLEAIARGKDDGHGGGSRRRVALALALLGVVVLGAGLFVRASRAGPATTPAPTPSPTPPPSPTPTPSPRRPVREILAEAQLALESDPDAAIRLATEVIERDPKVAAAWAVRATARERTYSAAKDAVGDATEALGLRLPPSAHAQILAVRAAARADLRLFEAARQDAKLALDGDPQNALAHAVAGEAEHWLRWLSLHRAGAIDEARREGSQALALDPNCARGALTRGLALWHGGRAEDLRELHTLAETVIAKLPRNPWGWSLRGLSRARDPDPRPALADLQHGSELAPENPITGAERLIFEYHHFDEDRAARVDPLLVEANRVCGLQDPPANAYTLRALLEKERWNRDPTHDADLDAAIADATQAIERSPLEPIAHHCRALCHLAKGRRALAIDDLRLVRQQDDTWAGGIATYAQVLVEEGLESVAFNELESFFHERESPDQTPRAQRAHDGIETARDLFSKLGGKP